MPEHSKVWIDDTTLRVMTYRSGSFTFQLGFEPSDIQPMLDRVNDSQNRFNKTPSLSIIIDQVQEKVLASSIYSTNTIEGGQFTEQETANILKQDPKTIQKSEERRLTNLKEAIDWVKKSSSKQLNPASGKPFELSTMFQLHKLVSKDLEEQHNPAGQLRNNQPTQKTVVGNAAHGGTYRPPKCIQDIEYLIQAWEEWLNSPSIISQPVVIRACLAHYYFELIHPFWDGNGRTGRLIEMFILEQSGYRFSSSAIWKYYQVNIHQYFALFNHCRKLADKKEPKSNQPFIDFVLTGMFETIEYLHDESNKLIEFLLYQTALNNAKFSREISDRQFNLIHNLMIAIGENSKFFSKAELYRIPQIHALYSGKVERTFYRDIDKLIELNFLSEKDGLILISVR
ncbi:Fic family protein [Acinetobacter pittii]|uniref:Fic family protein n=1 Tax=Acinetobacter pittii TaxID=48296 RepID=UPI00234238FA|nr:Fic family protein [Acinetobacter pittii]MDC5405553.1 Fic family protein [Acinetobacter baumannii]MDX8253304.1 Fic family protein [Acinetobacter pittii]